MTSFYKIPLLETLHHCFKYVSYINTCGVIESQLHAVTQQVRLWCLLWSLIKDIITSLLKTTLLMMTLIRITIKMSLKSLVLSLVLSLTNHARVSHNLIKTYKNTKPPNKNVVDNRLLLRQMFWLTCTAITTAIIININIIINITIAIIINMPSSETLSLSYHHHRYLIINIIITLLMKRHLIKCVHLYCKSQKQTHRDLGSRLV